MSNFFLCRDPLSHPAEGFVDHIYHHGTPKFFAGVFEFDLHRGFKPIDYGLPNKIFIYTRGDGQTRVFMLILAQRNRNITAKLETAMYRAISWYASVLNRTDEKNIGKRSSYKFLVDFNDNTAPGLQLLTMGKFNKYIVSYLGGVKSFDHPLERDRFLSEVLQYTDRQLAEGADNSLNIQEISD